MSKQNLDLDRVTKQYIDQLVEKIPAAFFLAVSSCNMTAREFIDAVIHGELKLTVFIPAMKKQIQEQLGGEFLEEFKLISAQELAAFMEDPTSFID